MRALLFAAILTGCTPTVQLGSRSQLSGEPSSASVEEVPVTGFPVEIARFEDPDVEGELLAVDENRVYLLHENRLASVAWDKIEKVTVIVRQVPTVTKVFLWLGLISGAATTAYHGVWMLASVPSWSAFGIPSTIYGANDTTGTLSSRTGWEALRGYARFPQGLPVSWR